MSDNISETDLLNFKNDLLEWSELNRVLQQSKSNNKKISDQLNKLKERNIDFMKSKGIDACNVDDGQISLRKTKKTILDIKKSNLDEILYDYFLNSESMSSDDAEKKTSQMMNYITENHSKTTEILSLYKKTL